MRHAKSSQPFTVVIKSMDTLDEPSFNQQDHMSSALDEPDSDQQDKKDPMSSEAGKTNSQKQMTRKTTRCTLLRGPHCPLSSVHHMVLRGICSWLWSNQPAKNNQLLGMLYY